MYIHRTRRAILYYLQYNNLYNVITVYKQSIKWSYGINRDIDDNITEQKRDNTVITINSVASYNHRSRKFYFRYMIKHIWFRRHSQRQHPFYNLKLWRPQVCLAYSSTLGGGGYYCNVNIIDNSHQLRPGFYLHL